MVGISSPQPTGQTHCSCLPFETHWPHSQGHSSPVQDGKREEHKRVTGQDHRAQTCPSFVSPGRSHWPRSQHRALQGVSRLKKEGTLETHSPKYLGIRSDKEQKPSLMWIVPSRELLCCYNSECHPELAERIITAHTQDAEFPLTRQTWLNMSLLQDGDATMNNLSGKKEAIPKGVHIPHKGWKPELGTDWWWELHCCLGEGRGASKEHMEQYKLFGAPRKTGKIIISVPETAHFCLQLSGTQTLHGQCLVPQNPHKYHGWGKATEGRIAALGTGGEGKFAGYPGSCHLSHLGFLWTVRMVTLWVILFSHSRDKCRCAHPASRRERQCPRANLIPLLQIPTLPKAPWWNQRGHWASLWFCSPPLKHRWAFPGWLRRQMH